VDPDAARALAENIVRDRGYRWVGIYEVAADEVAIVAWSGGGEPAFPRFPTTQGLTASAIAARDTVVVDDVTADERYLDAFGDTRSEMIVPVVVDGVVRGTIDVESERVAAFGPADRAYVERIAAESQALWT
jgi:L-methionine (R)-S-oxide reductase